MSRGLRPKAHLVVTAIKNQPLLPDLPVRRVEEMGLKELERIRLILRGGSVIEWRRMHFNNWDEVDRFLRLQQIDPTRKYDEAWVRAVLADAVEYLRKTFNYRVADAVANPNMIHDLFLYASGHIDKRMRKIACIVLKTMHVIQHIEARDVLFHIAVPEAELARMVTARVNEVMEEARQKGLPIVEFSDSIKTRESTITKLIAKKDSTAAVVYDRTRFRIIVKERDDVIPTLYFLNQRLLPFNFIVPSQTENTLIRFKDLVKQYPNFKKYARQLHLDLDFEERELAARVGNTFSGSTYKALNFVADVPLRLDAFLPPPEDDHRERKCRIALATCEFQIADEKTAIENEKGENSHERYKQRQRDVVLKRLSSGLVVPKKKRTSAGS
ncbi:MAG: TIGR04552 family protein [Archangium gephyra]|uniref:TIGR04552 family protein n=1 Tax=Archangium gephyra TaxID=48 RepID=A0A2W5TWM4_9BACT|nr:MAG: TIGR04552 family protein [Archangium gephyra]